MCWPGPHSQNCEERGKYFSHDEGIADRSSDKFQGAIFYAIDGDEASVIYFSWKNYPYSTIYSHRLSYGSSVLLNCSHGKPMAFLP